MANSSKQLNREGERPDFEACQELLGYHFHDLELLEAALTHASGAQHRLVSNERLEFLGDAILGAVVCEILYREYPNYLEGDLTKIKSVVVSRQTCAKISRAMGLDRFLILGKGMASDPKLPRSLLADVFESLVAAIYLDGGDAAARKFITDRIRDEIDLAVSGATLNNYKSQLQQEVQRTAGLTPTYHLVDEKGPDHSKSFMVAARVGEVDYPPAWGRSKKEAEQNAAFNALNQMSGGDQAAGNAG
ncbi:MAG: ribonuclease III [Planctomycetales bacterium]|nr:ribonuclease III [Planctomycetales bacterium]